MMAPYTRLLRAAEKFHPEGLYHVRNVTERTVALTIDDGPSSRTGEILDLLAATGSRATFFIHTDRVGPDTGGVRMIERMIEEGHEVANHMPDHRVSVRLTQGEFAREFARAHQLLAEFGPAPRFFRAAGGFFHVARMLPSLRDHGYFERFIMASYLPWDTHLAFPEVYARQLSGGAFPGAVFVLHDGDDSGTTRLERTLTTLKSLTQRLPARGYRMETLGNLLGSEPPA